MSDVSRSEDSLSIDMEVLGLFLKKCAKCHDETAKGGLNIVDNFGNITGKQALKIYRAVSSDNLAAEGIKPMPLGGRLEPKEIALIREWMFEITD